MSKMLYGFTKSEIDNFRSKYAEALHNERDSDGKPCLSEEHIRAYTSMSDEALAYNMQYNTPQSLADMDVL